VISPVISAANFGDASGMPCPPRPCIVPWPKRPAPPLSKIPVFLPVTKEEALKLEVSLSVLSRLFPIHPEAVEVGRHGLVISLGARRGLLLPQVSVEHGWDRETFLEQTCRKAGLPLGRLAQGRYRRGFHCRGLCRL